LIGDDPIPMLSRCEAAEESVVSRQLIVLVTFFLAAAILGCGGGGGLSLVRVKGKVSYKGQPVSGASVTFQPSEGTPAVGTTDANGEFTLTTGGRPGAVVGEHRVAITKYSGAATPMAEPKPEDMRKMQMERSSSGPTNEIPMKYANSATSGLVATVSSKASENEFEYTLVD